MREHDLISGSFLGLTGAGFVLLCASLFAFTI